jgi:hypothetical protein
MRRVKYFATGLWVDKHFSQWLTTIVIMIHVGLAMVVIVGGVERFSIPSYNPLIDYSMGNTWVWGVWIGLSAVLMATPFRWPSIIGLWLGMVWHVIWMACFTIAAINYSVAATTPIPMYGGLALICTALLTARVIENNER